MHEIGLPGLPGTITVFGPRAFPVVAAPSAGRPAALVAAARRGRGRVVLFGHDFFGAALARGDTGRLVTNVAAWAAGRRPARARVGVRGWKLLRAHLQRAGFTVVGLDDPHWEKHLDHLDVVFVPLFGIDEAQRAALARALAGGLGVVSGGPGWGWQQLHPHLHLAEDEMGNRLLAPAGLVSDTGTVQKPASGLLAVSGPAPALLHAGLALDALLAQAAGARHPDDAAASLAVATLVRAVRALPADDRILRPRLAALLSGPEATRAVPTQEHPLRPGDGLARLAVALRHDRDARLDPARVRADPAAAAFPGAVDPHAPRVARRVDVDTAVPGWHGTGLYAAPGEVVRVHLPRRAAGAGLALRIGAHKDRLWGKAVWRRAPEITVERPLDRLRSEHACAFGGLVYVVVPPRCALGRVDVDVAGAVEAPRYVLGETSVADWRARGRALPAPWAELETSKLVITVPSRVVRDLDDPEALMRWWDRVMDACADLAARPHERPRPERYVADVQISAGYMHAGYPIMTHLDAAPRFVDLRRLSTRGDWGMFHEMGHDHQSPDWTFEGTTEVTCNLFSLYLMDTVCTQGAGHGAMDPGKVARRRAAWRKAGPDFARWKREPFTALILYQDLARDFGWQAYRHVFAEYRALPPSERPHTDAQKRDQWLVRMSRTVGHDLGPAFRAWGIPVSKQALEAVASLPVWKEP